MNLFTYTMKALQIGNKEGLVDHDNALYTKLFKRNHSVNMSFYPMSIDDEYLLCHDHRIAMNDYYHNCHCRNVDCYSFIGDVSLYKVIAYHNGNSDDNDTLIRIIQALYEESVSTPFKFVTRYMRHYKKSEEENAYIRIANTLRYITDRHCDISSFILQFWIQLVSIDIVKRYKIFIDTSYVDCDYLWYFLNDVGVDDRFYRFWDFEEVTNKFMTALTHKEYESAVVLSLNTDSMMDVAFLGYDTVFNIS